MIVVDASVIADALTDQERAGAAARQRLARADDLAVPCLMDLETVSVLRKQWTSGQLGDDEFRQAVDRIRDLPVTRHSVLPLVQRAYELRANVTPYDAAYVALAEALDCTLVTTDARLAKAPGPTCQIEVIAA